MEITDFAGLLAQLLAAPPVCAPAAVASTDDVLAQLLAAPPVFTPAAVASTDNVLAQLLAAPPVCAPAATTSTDDVLAQLLAAPPVCAPAAMTSTTDELAELLAAPPVFAPAAATSTADVLVELLAAPPVCAPAATTSTNNVLAELLAAPPIGSLAAGPSTRSVEPLAVALDDGEAMTRPSKRPKIGILLDSAGQAVMPMRLREAAGPFIYISLSMLCARYLELFGHELFPDGSDQQDLHRALTTMEEFRSIHVRSVNLGMATSLNIIQRAGLEFTMMRQQLTDRLRLSIGYDVVVPGPLLFYCLTTLCCIRINQLSATALDIMFSRITGRDLGSLQFASRNGVRQITCDELFALVNEWLHSLIRFVVKGGSIKRTLKVAAKCYRVYLDKCYKRRNYSVSLDTDLDADGTIAREMLYNNEHCSWIFLGIREPELKTLFKHLPLIMDEADNDLKRVTKLTNRLFAKS